MNINKINILITAAGALLLAGCSTAYQTGQTPDDVYYSAPKEVRAAGGNDEYYSVNDNKDRYSPNRNTDPDYEDTYRNDRWLRMSIGNPYYLSTFNNYYWNDWGYSGLYGYNHGFNGFYGTGGIGFGAGFGYLNSWNNPWGNSIYWNSFYNPYAFNYNPYGYNYLGIAPNVKPPVYRTSTARPSVFNPRAYGNTNNRGNVNTTRSYYNPRTGTYSNNNNAASGNRVSNGNNTRRNNSAGTYYNTNTRRSDTYTPSSNTSSEGRPQRTYTPSTNSSSYPSSGGSGSGGGGGVRRPTRN